MRARRTSELRRRLRQEQSAGSARWLISYADFITLLFAFFTTLYAISVTDATKAERLVRSIRESFGSTLFEFGADDPVLREQFRGVAVRTDEDRSAAHPAEPERGLDLLGERARELSRSMGRASGLSAFARHVQDRATGVRDALLQATQLHGPDRVALDAAKDLGAVLELVRCVVETLLRDQRLES